MFILQHLPGSSQPPVHCASVFVVIMVIFLFLFHSILPQNNLTYLSSSAKTIAHIIARNICTAIDGLWHWLISFSCLGFCSAPFTVLYLPCLLNLDAFILIFVHMWDSLDLHRRSFLCIHVTRYFLVNNVLPQATLSHFVLRVVQPRLFHQFVLINRTIHGIDPRFSPSWAIGSSQHPWPLSLAILCWELMIYCDTSTLASSICHSWRNDVAIWTSFWRICLHVSSMCIRTAHMLMC